MRYLVHLQFVAKPERIQIRLGRLLLRMAQALLRFGQRRSSAAASEFSGFFLELGNIAHPRFW
jgi:hypothetical protein